MNDACGDCGESVEPDWQTCPHCGNDISFVQGDHHGVNDLWDTWECSCGETPYVDEEECFNCGAPRPE